MEIDVRKEIESDKENVIIRFGDGDYDIIEKSGASCIGISTNDAGEVWVDDIDNLIKALEKAKELWG